MTTHEIEAFALAWQQRLRAREKLYSLGTALMLGALVLVLSPEELRWWVAPVTAVMTFLITFGLRISAVNPQRVDARALARHLDRTHAELEESSALWLRRPEELSLVEKLQLMRLDRAYARLPQEFQSPAAPPAGMLRGATKWFLSGSMLALMALLWTWLMPHTSIDRLLPPATSSESTAATPAVKLPPPAPRLESAELTVVPPAYTRRVARTLRELDGEIEEGSTIHWKLTFSGDVEGVSLRFGDGGHDVLPMRALGQGSFEASRAISDSILYGISATLPTGGGWNPAEVHLLKVLKDRPPVVRFIEPAAPRTEVPAPTSDADAAKVVVRVTATDDYGVLEAHLVATVAKGTGENVKFREQAIEFDSSPPTDEPATAREFEKTLDLRALGLEPGDELYFHVAARDNREPDANMSRSETRFVLLKGPSDKLSTPGAGVSGLNLVPPYFRSQRQLIIDTEKLIADRPTLTDEVFRQRSNELGIDQQLLRFRYGQFLGEELEEGAGSHTDAPDQIGPSNASGVPLDMMHQHDRGPEGGSAPPDREAPAEKPASGVPPSAAQIMQPYIDQHDSQDEATFHDRPTKESLRSALAAMWEAEKFLRTARPAEALPSENRALEILKDLQQSARAYVQRVGFEPAPLKIKERRLQGDVSKVERLAREQSQPSSSGDADSLVRATLREIWWQRTSGALTSGEIESLRRVEPRLTTDATNDPEAALPGLQALRRLVEGQGNVSQELPLLERALWRLLPPARPLPTRAGESSPELSRLYFRALQSEDAKP